MMIDDREGEVVGDVSDDNDGDGSEDDDEAARELFSLGCSVCVCVGSNAIKQSISDQPFTLIPTHYL